MDVSCGIDVSKASLDVVALTQGGERHRRFENGPAGFEALLAWCQRLGRPLFAMEATGPYHKALLRFLLSRGQRAACLNPYRARQLAIGLGVLSKDDRLDASVLARAAALSKPATPVSPQREQALEISRRIGQLSLHLARERTRLREPRTSPQVRASLQRSLAFLEQELAAMEAEWLALVQSEPELQAAYRLLLSVPQVGPKTARVLLSELPPARELLPARRAVGLSGLAPRRKRSGASLSAPDRTSKACNKHLKRALYMPAVQAQRRSPELREFYMRLIANGKHPKQAIAAVMRKILSRALAVLARGTPWQEKPLTT